MFKTIHLLESTSSSLLIVIKGHGRGKLNLPSNRSYQSMTQVVTYVLEIHDLVDKETRHTPVHWSGYIISDFTLHLNEHLYRLSRTISLLYLHLRVQFLLLVCILYYSQSLWKEAAM